jgi:hypothetical protein
VSDADPDKISVLIAANARMRTGRKLGRTLYLAVGEDDSDDDLYVGTVDSVELALTIRDMWNWHR